LELREMDTPDTTDTDIDTDMTAGVTDESIERTSLDAFRQLLDLAAVLKEPNLKARVRQLQRAEGHAVAAQERLAAERAAHDAQVVQLAAERAELTADRVKLREGQVALANAKDAREDRLVERERRIRELEDRWRFIGEDDDVRSGFRTAEFGALYKARSAHGYASDATAGLDDIAEQMREKYPPFRTVRTDPQGVEFPAHVSLSRSEPAPPAGARVRPGRRNSAPPVST
jgi:hypothetical protein